jgi:hypothetical protein
LASSATPGRIEPVAVSMRSRVEPGDASGLALERVVVGHQRPVEVLRLGGPRRPKARPRRNGLVATLTSGRCHWLNRP